MYVYEVTIESGRSNDPILVDVIASNVEEAIEKVRGSNLVVYKTNTILEIKLIMKLKLVGGEG